jgi:hypothetical protein
LLEPARLRHRNQSESGLQACRAFDTGYRLMAPDRFRTVGLGSRNRPVRRRFPARTASRGARVELCGERSSCLVQPSRASDDLYGHLQPGGFQNRVQRGKARIAAR